MKGNFGFLCMSTRIDGNYAKIYEKDEFTGKDYKNILKLTKGFVPKERAPMRIYNCPLNYEIEGDFISDKHIDFTVSCLSMAFGVKLVSKSYSYVDNTNITPLHLGYVEMSQVDNKLFLDNALLFYQKHIHNNLDKIKIIENAIYLLFRAKTKHNFSYENFLLLYTAIDCCYKYYNSKDKPGAIKLLNFLCQKVNIDIMKYEYLLKYIADIRNEMIHEGTFLGSYFAHEIKKEKICEYLSRGAELFLREFLIRLIFKMLMLDMNGFLTPLSRNKTLLNINSVPSNHD